MRLFLNLNGPVLNALLLILMGQKIVKHVTVKHLLQLIILRKNFKEKKQLK